MQIDQGYICCVNLDEDWWIKIVNNYGITDFINIKGNLRDPDSIEHIEDLFTHIILPATSKNPQVDQYGNIVYWTVADYQNLYTLNELPPEYSNLEENPKCCFDPESGDVINYDVDETKNYFDSILIDFK